MKKRPLLLVLYLLMFIPLGRTQEVVFREDFDNNSRGWRVSGGDGVSRSIKNGKYVWEGTSGSDFKSCWEMVPLKMDQSRNFMMEASVRKVSGPESGWGFGLIWGNEENRFTVFGSLASYSVAGNVYDKLTSDSINTGNATNKLKIIKTGREMKFYINDTYLASVTFERFDPKIGLYFYINNVRLEVENIYITYLAN